MKPSLQPLAMFLSLVPMFSQIHDYSDKSTVFFQKNSLRMILFGQSRAVLGSDDSSLAVIIQP